MTNVLKHHQQRAWTDEMRPLNDKRFIENCFETGQLVCKELEVTREHPHLLYSMELSKDETFFITGGDDQRNEKILMWSVKDLFGNQDEDGLKPTAVIQNAWYDTAEHANCILSVAISPDDCRVFGGGYSKRVLIYDLQRNQILHSIPHFNEAVFSISVKSDSLKGDVFATGSKDNVELRIFDIRSSTKVPVIASDEGARNGLYSITFSPFDTTHVATAGLDGASVIDIRQPNEILLSLSSDPECKGIRYNSRGTRLIWTETEGPKMVDLSVFSSSTMPGGEGTLNLATQEENTWKDDYMVCSCGFAGRNDELAVAASYENFYMWSVPHGLHSGTIDPLVLLSHRLSHLIPGFFYSHERSALVTSATGGDFFKVWTPFKPSQS